MTSSLQRSSRWTLLVTFLCACGTSSPRDADSGTAKQASESAQSVTVPAADAESESSDSAVAESEPEPEPEQGFRNDVRTLLEHAPNITNVDIIELHTGFKLRSLKPTSAAVLRNHLVEVEGLTDSEPRWKVALAIYASDLDVPLIAIPVGTNRIRLNPDERWRPMLTDADRQPGSEVAEVEVDPKLFATIGKLVRTTKPPDKKHQMVPRFDRNPYRTTGRRTGRCGSLTDAGCTPH